MILLLLTATACGGGGSDAVDGATASNHRLVILDPPSESIGLGFGANVNLRVRYETTAGAPIIGAVVTFALAGPSDTGTGGASLSSIETITDGAGVASVDLTAGAEQINFQVEAAAANAPGVSFYVAVSDTGFAELVASPAHLGWRAVDVFNRIEIRLYRGTDLSCRELDADMPAPSPFPPRSLSEFGGDIAYQSMIPYMPYTLVGWAVGPDDTTALAIGCIDIAAETTPPQRIELELVIRDRAPLWPQTVELSSTLDMTAIASAVAMSPAERLWRIMECPAGLGQLLIDCAVDAALDDGVLDCIVNTTGPLLTSIEAKRGAVDANGCRPQLLPGDAPSIDKLLTQAITNGGTFPSGATLSTLLQQRKDVQNSVRIDSHMAFHGLGVMTHQLRAATITADGTDVAVDLTTTNRPIISQSQVGYAIDSSRNIVVDEHGYTLRWGSLVRDGFDTLGLEPVGLGGKDEELGSQITTSANDGATTGCEAVSNVACGAAGLAPTCLQTACGEAKLALDLRLSRWWQQLNGSEIDLWWAGTAPVRDDDYDLLIDRVGTEPGEAGPGIWAATIELQDGTTVDVVGAFSNAKSVP